MPTSFLDDPTLFKALEAINISVTLDEQKGQQTGPIMLSDGNGREALVLISSEDHRMFDEWRQAIPTPTDVELKEFATAAIGRILDKERYKEVSAVLDQSNRK